MQVNKLMTRGVACVDPDTTLQEAAERMKLRDVGALPVCNNHRLVGMITDRDITIRAIAEGHDPWTDHVGDAMTSQVFYCFEDEDASEAARIMKDRKIRRLPVLDHEKHLVGILSLGDLAMGTGDRYMTGRTLEGIAEAPATH